VVFTSTCFEDKV